MRVELASLESGRGEFAYQYAPEELDFNDERVTLLVAPWVGGRIKRDGAIIRVDGRITARVKVECDRCLKEVELPAETEFNLEYVTADEYTRLEAAELSEADLKLSVFDGEAIDIDEIVREQILLAVPSQVVCQESCKGLCPNCGTNLNLSECGCRQTEIDPRWAALKDLQ
jgi:uncharacterized protein